MKCVFSLDSSLRGVTLNVAARDGNAAAAPTVEACRCPTNYTGSSCEKCAEGYGRPQPLVGIYLGQCWSCRSLCNDRSDRCDRETGKCQVGQQFHSIVTDLSSVFLRTVKETVKVIDVNDAVPDSFSMDAAINASQRVNINHVCSEPLVSQCRLIGSVLLSVDPSQPAFDAGTRGAYYIDQRPYDPRGQSPLSIVLDGNLPEQRVPLQVLVCYRSRLRIVGLNFLSCFADCSTTIGGVGSYGWYSSTSQRCSRRQ